MKLRFFNGTTEQEDQDRLAVVNRAIQESGLAFEEFSINRVRVSSLEALGRRMASPDPNNEVLIAMLHWGGCGGPALANDFPRWNEGLRRNAMVILFSGDSLSESTVRSVVEAGQGANIAGVFRLDKGFREAISTPEFNGFFEWLASEPNASCNDVCEKWMEHLQSVKARETACDFNAALKVLCEAWLLKNWIEAEAKAKPLCRKFGWDKSPPPLPMGFTITCPGTHEDWFAPFGKKPNAADEIAEAMGSSKKEVSGFLKARLAPRNNSPTFAEVAGLFLALDKADARTST